MPDHVGSMFRALFLIVLGTVLLSCEEKMENYRELTQFFEAELQFMPGMKSPVSSAGRIGELLGSGEGFIHGKKISGSIRWSIFEVVGNPCETNITGHIQTNDGATIALQSKGFGLVPDKSKSNQWHLAATLILSTDDARYDWLNTVIAFWDGEFDMSTGRHSYTAYLSD